MEILEKKVELIFRDPVSGEIHPITELNILNDYSNLEKNHWYIIGDNVYQYIGEINSIKEIHPGVIVNFNGYHVEDYTDADLEERFSIKNVLTKDEYNREIGKASSLEDLIGDYIQDYENGNNLMLQESNTTTISGEVFIPELRPDDDPFEKAIKSMLRYKKIVLNSYKGNVEKAHVLDNLRSALSGATKSMSVTKFLLWCNVLGLDWEIRLTNADSNVKNPLKDDIWVSNTHDPWVDIKPAEDKSIFVVPLVKTDNEKLKDDPLKKLIKLALDQKRVNMKDYEEKSSSDHLINNMKSALKSKQKATLLYFMSWCELLDMMYEIKVTDPETGVYFQVIGYDLYTNADEESLKDPHQLNSTEEE